MSNSNSNFNYFIQSVISGDVNLVKQCFRQEYLEITNDKHETAIIVSCRNGHVEIVELLIKHNCNIEAKTEFFGETAIIVACQNGHVEIVELLIKHNCNIEAANYFVETSIIVACQNGHVEIVELLIKHNCNIEAKNYKGETAIIVACQNGYVKIVELLIKNNCNIEAKSEFNDETAIIVACLNGHVKIVQLLIKHYCNIEAKNYNGETAIIVACQNGYVKIVELLKKEITKQEYKNRIVTVMKSECDQSCNHQFCIKTLSSEEFRKNNKIGSGAFGTVYKLKDDKTDLIIAVKEINIDKNKAESKYLEQNINEYRDKIIHKYILQYFGAVVKNNKMFIFMEFVEQGSLKDQIKKSGSITNINIIRYSKQILKAVQFLHENKIIHRDLKPGNILININDNIKLCDFGVSRIMRRAISSSNSMTQLQTECGTANYMAPEMINNEGHNYPVDIWAFGATVVEMLTGKPPYPDLPSYTVIAKIGSTKSINFQPSNDIPKNMKSFIHEIFHPEPSKRPTAKQLLQYINNNNLME